MMTKTTIKANEMGSVLILKSKPQKQHSRLLNVLNHLYGHMYKYVFFYLFGSGW